MFIKKLDKTFQLNGLVINNLKRLNKSLFFITFVIMKIKYKNFHISISRENSLCVDYIDKEDKNKFFFYYINLENKKVKQLFFKGGMVIAPQRMKDTMEDLKSKFESFQEVGGGTIEDYFLFLLSFERDEKLNQLGI